MDQISNRTIAVKKLAEPFKSENIARHMYREVKLLKTLKHDNVRRYQDWNDWTGIDWN